MELVWPEYLNACTTELRSSIPVHITQGSDKASQGSMVWRDLGDGVEIRKRVYFSQGLKLISSLFPITVAIVYSIVHFVSVQTSDLLVQWIRNDQRSR